MKDKHKDRALQEFAARFCKALKAIGYLPHQQGALGTLFGVSGQAVRRWAEGLAMPTPSRMPHVASVLGVRRAWLQDGEDPMLPTSAHVSEPLDRGRKGRPDNFAISNDEAKLVTDYRLLSPAQKKALRELISIFRNSKS